MGPKQSSQCGLSSNMFAELRSSQMSALYREAHTDTVTKPMTGTARLAGPHRLSLPPSKCKAIPIVFSNKPHPWFIPVYRRVLTLAVCVLWVTIELIGQEMMWVMIAGAACGYAVWEFFLGPAYRGVGKAAPPDQDP